MAGAAVGFRVKSGWAAAVVLSGPVSSPLALHARRIDLSDPAIPATRQPYHAVDPAQGELEDDESRIKQRVNVVRRVTTESLEKLLADFRTNAWTPRRVGIVAGSLIDPATIRQPHIRAHAMEGRLFRTVLEDVVRARGLSCFVLGEKTALTAAVKVIHRRKDAIRRTLGKLGRHVDGPWRTVEKMAALAAWVAVAET